MCVVTLKSIELGEETPASAYLEPENGNGAIQDGGHKFLRWPVRAAAAGTCVGWGGSVDDVSFDGPLDHLLVVARS